MFSRTSSYYLAAVVTKWQIHPKRFDTVNEFGEGQRHGRTNQQKVEKEKK